MRKLVIGLVVAALAVSYLGFQAFQGATVLYYTAAQVRDPARVSPGEVVRVRGRLVPGSFERAPGEETATFRLLGEEGAELEVLQQGPVPDLFFNRYSKIVVQGTYGGSGQFDADRIMVKCPTRFQEARAGVGGEG